MIKKNQAQGKGAIWYRLDSNNDFSENINSWSKTNVTLLMLVIYLYFIDQEYLSLIVHFANKYANRFELLPTFMIIYNS